MAGLNAGDLDRDITIKTATKTQDVSSGEEVIDWDLLDDPIAAQWLPAGTRETWQAQSRLEGFIDGIFRIYWRDDIVPDATRILWDGKLFDVRPPVEGGRQEWLDIPVTARAEASA